jgi:hypothetical protein
VKTRFPSVPVPPGAVIVEERKLPSGVISRTYSYPSESRTGVTRLSKEPAKLRGKASSSAPSRPSSVGEGRAPEPASPASSRKRRTAPWDVHIADPRLLKEIARDCFVDTNLHGVESGGLLLGLPPMEGSLRDPAAQILILDASGPNRTTNEQSAARIELSFDMAASQRYWHHRDTNAELIGDWHSHPSGDSTPSRGDFNGWARAHELYRHPWVGLLLFERRGAWTADVYITHTVDDRIVCDRGQALELE